MEENSQIDYDTERGSDVANIVNSIHSRKVVVAGPGTGKSFLFEQVIKKKQEEGKTNFLAITFIGKLGDSLADDLAGIANTHTSISSNGRSNGVTTGIETRGPTG